MLVAQLCVSRLVCIFIFDFAVNTYAAVVIFLDELANLEAIEDLCRNVRVSMAADAPNNQTSQSVACL